MNDNLIVVLIILTGCGLFIWVSWLKQRKKDRIPTIEIEATVLSRQARSRSVRGAYGATNTIYNVVTFRLANGTVVELNTPAGSKCWEEGTTGILIYQGEKCEKFTPYE